MATPKFDSIAIEFMKMIKGKFKTSFTPGSAMPGADFLTADQISTYVNSALSELASSIWNQAAGNMEVFAGVMPELIVQRDIIMSTQPTLSLYTIVSPNLDFLELIEAIGEDEYGVIGKKHLFLNIKAGKVPQYTGTASRPIFVNNSNTIYCFPAKATATINIVTQPVDPTTGSALIQNGNHDSPFKSIWENKLAQIAYESYLVDSNVQS